MPRITKDQLVPGATWGYGPFELRIVRELFVTADWPTVANTRFLEVQFTFGADLIGDGLTLSRDYLLNMLNKHAKPKPKAVKVPIELYIDVSDFTSRGEE